MAEGQDEKRAMAEGFAKLDLNGPVPMGRATIHGGVKQLMTCPYNESHRVGFGHFALHLMKCRAAAGQDIRDRFVVCKFNATHHMDKSVYKEHLTICDDFREYQEYRATRTFRLPPNMAPRAEFVDITKWKCYGNPKNSKADEFDDQSSLYSSDDL